MRVGDFEWAIDAVGGIVQPLIALLLPEIGQQRIPFPSGAAGRFIPFCVIGRNAACVGHGIDRTTAAEHVALHDRDGTAAERRLRFGFVNGYKGDWPKQELDESGRHFD